MRTPRPTWFNRVRICFSQLINVVCCNGDPDEMLSARAYRMQHVSRRWAMVRRTFDRMFFWQIDHCHQSYQWEHSRVDIDPEYL